MCRDGDTGFPWHVGFCVFLCLIYLFILTLAFVRQGFRSSGICGMARVQRGKCAEGVGQSSKEQLHLDDAKVVDNMVEDLLN